MRRLTDRKIVLLRQLRTRGFGFKTIAKQLCCSPASVHKYTKNIPLSKQAKASLIESQKKLRANFAAQYAKEKEIILPPFSVDLARILGHLFFDGSVAFTNGKYMLSYCNSSIELINEFILKVHTLFSLKPAKISKFKGVNLDWYQSTFYSKKAFYFVKRFSSSFSTSKNIGVPVEIMTADDSLKESFLLAFWADEGCINYRGHLTGSSKSKKMIDNLVSLHKSLGIDCKKHLNKKRKAHSLSIKRTLSNYSKFCQKVGFGKAIVKAGYNLGRYKQEVLAEHLNKMASF